METLTQKDPNYNYIGKNVNLVNFNISYKDNNSSEVKVINITQFKNYVLSEMEEVNKVLIKPYQDIETYAKERWLTHFNKTKRHFVSIDTKLIEGVVTECKLIVPKDRMKEKFTVILTVDNKEFKFKQ